MDDSADPLRRAGDPDPPRPRPRRFGTPALDGIDEAILELITGDGRMPLTGLAQRLKLGRSTVQVRLARLEAEGVIAGYTIRQGPNHPAGAGLRALVTVTAEHRRITDVGEALARIPEVTEVCSISGEADLVLDVRATGAANLEQVLATVRSTDGVLHTSTSVVLATQVGARHPLP